MVVSAIECELAYHVWVSHHVDLNELGWCWYSVFVGDREWDGVCSEVVDKSLGRLEWHHCASWCCAHVSGGQRWWY